MARIISAALQDGRHAVIEAGTGSGKSFGYLIPILGSGKTTVISTRTIALHALYFTDLAMGGGVLPNHDLVVFDEAHHLDRAAVGALSVQVTRWMGNKLLQRVQRRFSGVPAQIVQDLTDAEADFMDYLY